jgi:hypothetical protein
MTTVHTPNADARPGAVAGGGESLGGPDDPVVLPVLLSEAFAPGVVDVRRPALPGDRMRRLQQRRRLAREQLLAVLFLLVALAITVGVLAMQWLGNGGPTSGTPAAAPTVVTNILSGGPV